MPHGLPSPSFDQRVISALYTDALVLADDAKAYFEEQGRMDRSSLSPGLMVSFSIESLRVTTRLMHVIAWLLTRRAVFAGELSVGQAAEPERLLGASPPVDALIIGRLPLAAAAIIGASVDLHARAAALETSLTATHPARDPVRTMWARLETSFRHD